MTGHPPVASGVICIDFDSTLWEWGDLDCNDTGPTPGAAEAVRSLKRAGYTIVIFTSRLSPTWWRDESQRRGVTVSSFANRQKDALRNALARAGIPYDSITSEKVPALAYLDDKAIRVSEGYPVAAAIADFLEDNA